MKKIRLLDVEFENEINAWKVPAFRGAVIATAGKENKQEGLMLGNRPYELRVEQINLNKFTLQVWDRSFNYFLQDWLPFNQDNFHKFKILSSEIEQLEFLEKILTGNILSFAKGVAWRVDKDIKVRIQGIIRTNIINVKGIKREAYTLNFTSNVSLPNHIGLGKNVSMGFGVAWEVKK